MTHFEFLDKLIVLAKLIKKECTGTPEELMKRLSIGRDMLYKIINELNSYGVDIKYSRTRRTFYYDTDAVIEIYFDIKDLTEIDDPEELKNISGGCKLFCFRPFFRTEGL